MPGEYEAIFTLLQPGQAAERVKQSGTTRIFEIQDHRIVGDSHLALSIPKDARPSPNAEIRLAAVVGVDRLDGNADDVEMVLLPNDEGRLSKVSVKLNAQNFSDAESRAYFEASSYLSNLAFELDIPLRIAHTSVKETKTGQDRIGFVRQFGYKGVGNLPEHGASGELGTEMKGAAYAALTGIYREALNSESPFYQFLCFCRIIQRLKEKLRPRWQKIIAEHDKSLLPTYRKYERMPDKGDQAKRFPYFLKGKKFNAVYDDHLRPLRNGIGHVFLEDMDDETSAERSTDEFEFINDVHIHLPVAHYMAKTMLKNDFKRGGLAYRAVTIQA